MSKAQFILDNSELLVKSDCIIVDDTLYECCKLDNKLFSKSDFINNEDETYYLSNDEHVYRYFIDTDDYDYVNDAETVKKLNAIFAAR